MFKSGRYKLFLRSQAVVLLLMSLLPAHTNTMYCISEFLSCTLPTFLHLNVDFLAVTYTEVESEARHLMEELTIN